MKRSRRKFSTAFKSKVVLEALKEQKSIQGIASSYEVHPNRISQWKARFLTNAEKVFERPSEGESAEELEK